MDSYTHTHTDTHTKVLEKCNFLFLIKEKKSMKNFPVFSFGLNESEPLDSVSSPSRVEAAPPAGEF